MDIYHTIIRPLVTEKSTHQSRQTSKGHGGTYSFEVHSLAVQAIVEAADREEIELPYPIQTVRLEGEK